ncbi:competence/damage-inducible protein A [Emcibacter nanhaiensis]|uniref:Competence/damage-inducible protein A n=1 Tax=Emcibacter nanhaiensis TaxID=1505037 RepID=A0A501PB27_9PROT|nr:molybdopterin-binding protein [Emcibacter nanhaiensis]TPD57272.1 competence/damage-inducible protein A [Emcibacter nanhaiensis]
MNRNKTVTAGMIVIGDEILSGRTRDANLNHLAHWLTEQGIQLREARVIADDGDVIVDTVNELRARYDYLFTTGGIGPTHDDITSENIARALGVPFVQNPEAYDVLKDHYGPDGLTEARLRMAMMPEGAELIDNPISRAPGIHIGNIFVLAGIPVVMQAMLLDVSKKIEGGDKMISRTIHVFRGESFFADLLGQVNDVFEEVSIGSYPFYYEQAYGATFVLRSQDEVALDEALGMLKHKIVDDGYECHDGEPAFKSRPVD